MNTAVNVAPVSFLSALRRSWWVLLLYGIAGIVFGVIALTRPLVAASSLAWAMGVLALVEAAITLVALFSKEVAISKGWLVLYLIASLLFGVLAVAYPMLAADSLILVLAAWLIVAGIFRIAFAIRVRQVIRGEWLLILSGLLAIVLGVLFAMYPLAGVVTTTLWIGAFALVYGVLQVIAAFRMRKLARAL